MSSTAATWDVGRIYETPDSPDHLRWFCRRANRVATLEEAKAQFQKNWDAWKAWTNMEEQPGRLGDTDNS